MARLDAETAAGAGLVIDPGRLDPGRAGSGMGAIQIHGRWVWPTVSWLRHFSAQAMPASGRPVRRAFDAESWQALADQLAGVSAATITCRQPSLLAQLAAARSRDVAIPRTIVTTDTAAAAELLDSPAVIVKALHRHYVEATPGLLTMVFPEVIERRMVGSIAAGPPVVVQEYIDHQAEVRAYYAHGRVAAFAIAKSAPGQPWLDPEGVTGREIKPSPELTRTVTALAEALGLAYGAFDFLVSAGTLFFLEVNVAGDWLWLERKAGTAPVTNAVVRMLQSMHRHCIISGQSEAKSGVGLNPVTFLSRGIALPPIDNDDPTLYEINAKEEGIQNGI